MKERVLQLIPSFHQGGSELQAIQLTRLLATDGTYDVRVACLDAKGVLREEARDLINDDIPEFPLNSFYDLNMARQLRRFCGLLKKERIHIIQTHDFYTNIFGMAAAKLSGVPVRIAAKRETEMRTKAQAFVERRAFGLANVVAVNSQRVRRYLQAAGVPDTKLEVVYNGIDQSKFDVGTVDRKKLINELGIAIDPDLRIVTIVANVQDPVKNQEMFLRAASALAGRHQDTAFVIAGEGERIASLRKLASDMHLNGNAAFLGRCQRVPELLAASEICVLTSRSEGFSNSILEYMAAGKPVVATDVGGAAEAIVENETGHLVPSDDDSALADRLEELLADPERARRMGEAGRRRVAAEFSTERQLERTLSLYDRELQRSRDKRSGKGLNDKMRIAQIGPVPPPTGGVAANMRAIHDELLRLGHDSTLIDVTNRSGGSDRKDVIKPRSVFGLLRVLAVNDFDIVHYHIGGKFDRRLAMLTLICGLLPGKKSVVTFHSGGFAGDAVRTARQFSLGGFAFRSVDFLIGVNDQILEMFKAYGPKRTRMRKILPFELKRPDPTVLIPVELDAAISMFNPLILSVGALEPEYNNEFLIRSMPRILDYFPNAGLAIVGSGSLQGTLDIPGELNDRILMTGDLEHDIVLHLIERSDVLARITNYDGDAISVREAMYLGTPVIASDNEMRPPGVFLLKRPFAVQDLVKGLEWAGKAQFAGQTVEVSDGRNAEKVVEVYKEILRK